MHQFFDGCLVLEWQDCLHSEASLRDAKERVRKALAEAGQFRRSPQDLLSRSGV